MKNNLAMKALRESLWKQFGASIDMLSNAITMWPDELWSTRKKFFYNAYHCLVFLDYYLTYPANPDFSSPLPFTLAEEGVVVQDAIDDIIPDRIYSKEELLEFLGASREKCMKLISGLTDETINDRWIMPSWNMNFSVLELLLYNMRHVQHHAAQLNMMLRQEINNAPRWVRRAKDP
jgi:hypothetical protein